jgi:hypothetical protein
MSGATQGKPRTAEEAAFAEAVARARVRFSNSPGVVHVAMGVKQRQGAFGGDIAIVVFVAEKLPLDRIAEAARIPAEFEGYPTDVRTVPRTVPGGCDNETKYEVIRGGMQISAGPADNRVFQGTLSCIVRRRQDRGRENVYLLSCKHVLFNRDHGVGDSIYQPRPETGEVLGPVQPGEIYDNVAFEISPGVTRQVFLDCAIARINIDCKCLFGSTCTKDSIEYAESIIDLQVDGVDTIKDVRNALEPPSLENAIVFKVGRKTGKTRGRIVGLDAPFGADAIPVLGLPEMHGVGTIEIVWEPETPGALNCQGNAFFAEQGDSGSLVVDEQGRALGIISQVPPPGAPPGTTSNACHIVPILDRLGICIPCTTGTSHGSSRARDGSGLDPALPPPPPLGDFPVPDGEFGFADGALTAPVPRPEFPIRQLSEPEAQHMRALLARFRETERGRAIHAMFKDVRREMGYLVRNNRAVKVAWHRNQGPAYLNLVLNHLAGTSQSVPHVVRGVPREQLLLAMRKAFTRHGSNLVRRELERYGDELFALLVDPDCHAIDHCLRSFAEKEPA